MLTLKDIEKLFQEKDIPYDMHNGRVYYVHHTDKEKIRMNVVCDIDDVAFSMIVFAMNAGEKTEAVRNAIDEANEQYKYWKFSLDRDNDLRLEFQTPIEYLNDTEIYIDMVLIASKIIDDFYPKLQRARFATADNHVVDELE